MTQTTARRLSVAEVAERLKLHDSTVYRLIQDGELQAETVPLGFDRRKALRIREDDLNEFIRRRQEGAA